MSNTYKNIFKCGSYADYVALEKKDPDVLYFCTDNRKVFVGNTEQLICNSCAAPLNEEDIIWENDYAICKCQYCGTSNVIFRKN